LFGNPEQALKNHRMSPEKNKPETIDAYIAGFPEPVQRILQELRATIRAAAPDATETISYQIPTFTLKGKNLVHFGAFKNHIGLYPAPSGLITFKEELSVYEGAKGSVRFPVNDPMPLNLVTKIVKFRVNETLEAVAKVKKKQASASLFAALSAPASRALENKGIQTPEQLAGYSEAEILELHGMGPGSLPKLRQILAEKGLAFRNG